MKKNDKTLASLLSEAINGFSPEKVYFAEESPPPPIKAIRPNRTRLLIGVEGIRNNMLSYKGKITNMELKKHEILYASPPSWHKPLRRLPHSIINIVFDKEYTNIVLKGYSDICSSYWPPVNHTIPDLYHLMQSINSIENPNAQTFAPSMVKALLEMILNYIDRPRREKSLDKAKMTWINVCNYLDDNFNNNAVSRESVATVFNMHPNHLSRLFKTNGKETFSERLNRLRMESAMLLLRTNQTASIKETADQCGFDSANYFCRAFKRFTGKSPGKYQRNQS
jgi:AraC-like DNA-binding protein